MEEPEGRVLDLLSLTIVRARDSAFCSSFALSFSQIINSPGGLTPDFVKSDRGRRSGDGF
jgi:hypothetical protein